MQSPSYLSVLKVIRVIVLSRRSTIFKPDDILYRYKRLTTRAVHEAADNGTEYIIHTRTVWRVCVFPKNSRGVPLKKIPVGTSMLDVVQRQ